MKKILHERESVVSIFSSPTIEVQNIISKTNGTAAKNENHKKFHSKANGIM